MNIPKLEDIKITIVGLGYVGLPLAVEFSKHFPVVGFDKNEDRISQLNKNIDITMEISEKRLSKVSNLKFSNLESDILDSNIYIITVPTPVDKNKAPDLKPLISASELVGSYINKSNIIIFESTVYPGATEEVCVPTIEKKSGLIYNKEFYCGYSPERINPGDKEHTLTSIIKVTSGSTKLSAELIDDLYNKIIKAGTYRASSIAVAEAAKVIENTQRDVNIALINELALIFNKLKLDTSEILKVASTKWNFLPFKPGLVGGHCIGVDPYYLTHRAMEVGYHPEIILAGRRINDHMGQFIADTTISELALQGISSLNAKIAVLGLTFKENCPDIRNTKVISILDGLNSYKCKTTIVDDWADPVVAKSEFNINLKDINTVKEYDAIIIAVAHDSNRSIGFSNFQSMLKPKGVI
ncbi:MAG: nucleotide sugar dehydrogenase, partial [Candidatus Neomarinimicrobiota bacterium]